MASLSSAHVQGRLGHAIASLTFRLSVSLRSCMQVHRVTKSTSHHRTVLLVSVSRVSTEIFKKVPFFSPTSIFLRILYTFAILLDFHTAQDTQNAPSHVLLRRRRRPDHGDGLARRCSSRRGKSLTSAGLFGTACRLPEFQAS